MGTYLTGTYSVIHTIGDADFDNFVYSSIYFNVAGAFIINGIVVIGVVDKSVDIIVNENTTTLSTDFLLLGNPIAPQTKVKTGLISGDSHNEVWEFVNIKNGLSTISKNVSPKGSSFTNTYSLDFDGVDDYLDLGASSTVADSGQFTLSFWIKGTSQSIGAKYLFSADYYNLHTFWTVQDTELYWRNINNSYKLLSTNLLDGEWHHILIIWNPDGANSTIRCFTDGANEVNVATDYRYAPGWNGGAYQGGLQYIGNRGGGTFPGFNGNIDEFAVWNDDQSANVSTIYNGGTPNDLTDLSPDYWYRNGDNGAYKSPQWLIPNNENKDKVSNYSLDFDGVDDYVSIPNNVDLNFTSAYSVSFWIKTTSSALLSPISNQSKFLIRLYAPSNQIRLQLYDGSNGFFNLDNTQVFNDGNWHHIAFTTEATTTTDKVIVYFDGVALANKGTQLNIGSHLSAFAYAIGRNSGTWNFNGGIDEVSLYDSELSASQINDIYNGGEPTTISGAVAHYKMGEDATFSGGVWTVPDSVGSNNGTSNAMTIDDRVGEAPNSENNALSLNMDEVDRVEDTPLN